MSNNEKQVKCEARGAKKNVVRKFKEIDPTRILDIEKHGILPIGTDEVFVLIKDSNTHYISNYGRCVGVTNQTKILKGNMSKNGKIFYCVPIWTNANERVYRNCNADSLVVETFHAKEMSGQIFIWHSGNNNEDNYYRNLYPMSVKEYRSIKKFYQNGGFDSEEKIMELLNGEIYNTPSLLGVGYWGMPDVDVHHWTYRCWCNMLMRAYSEKYHKIEPSYIGVSVAEEWHSYANFKKWVEENYYTVGEERMELDKDILHKGNTVYSSENCIFVPKNINGLIINAKAARNEYPVGIDYFNNKYRARMAYSGKQIVIGEFDNLEEAFNRYKEYKEKFIKDIAERYKDKIPDKLYQAMVNWKIEYDD